jgi:transcription antitermination factor NusG
MGWAVAQTYAACERRAVENLERQNCEAFCPLFARPSKLDATRSVDSPLFPCYVFVCLDPHQLWHSINSTYGVIRLLTDRNRLGPRPMLVPDEKVSEVLRLAETVVAR